MPAGTRCTWPSRTGSTTSTSARSSAPPTRSTWRRCTFWAGGAGTGAARWSPTATCTCTTTPTCRRFSPRWRNRASPRSGSTTCPARCRWSAELPQRCCLVFGSEGPGLTDEVVAGCAALVSITQYGSTRSLNAGAAAAIAMYHWALTLGRPVRRRAEHRRWTSSWRPSASRRLSPGPWPTDVARRRSDRAAGGRRVRGGSHYDGRRERCRRVRGVLRARGRAGQGQALALDADSAADLDGVLGGRRRRRLVLLRRPGRVRGGRGWSGRPWWSAWSG